MSRKVRLLFFLAVVLVVAWLAFGAKLAMAEDINLSWTNATEVESCLDAGPRTDPAGVRIWQLVQDVADPTATSFVIPDQPPGDYTYAATSYDGDGSESRLSGKTTKTVTSFTAVAGSQVFQPVSINSGFWMIPMGTLNADTECDANTPAGSAGVIYYRVPLDNVDWLPGSNARPVLVVAECG